MPLYEYRCGKCGQTYEGRQKFSDEPLTIHEGCGGELEKLISASAFQLKGSGWEVTDYARGGKSSSSESGNGKSDTKSENKSESPKTETKSETKTETKSESKPAPTKPS